MSSYYRNTRVTDFSTLVGKTLAKVSVNDANDDVLFVTDSGERFHLLHFQDCCECVTIEDIDGDLADLVGSPITRAEEVCGDEAQPTGWTALEYEDSWTWTFYKIDTAKGGVTIRWFGSSNGCYSESVDFVVEV